jgi:site-specific DNA-methyltransferase (adenine-specific)
MTKYFRRKKNISEPFICHDCKQEKKGNKWFEDLKKKGKIVCLVCCKKWYHQNHQLKLKEKSETLKNQPISIKKENDPSLMSMNYENDSKYLLGIRQQSALEEDSVPQEAVDLIITSPPYNVGIDYGSNGDNLTYEEYLNFSHTWLKNCYHWTKPTGRLCLNIPLDKNKNGKNSVCADITTLAKKVGWKYQTTIIWNEGNISRRTAWGSWMSASAPSIISPVEVIIVFYKEEWKKNKPGISDISKEEFVEWTNGLWTFPGENSKKVNHPAPFPRELPKRCLKLFSFVGDIVLDPFCGSGTTLIEAINNKRYAWGLEIDEIYIKNGIGRIEKECSLNISSKDFSNKNLKQENKHDAEIH